MKTLNLIRDYDKNSDEDWYIQAKDSARAEDISEKINELTSVYT